MTKCTSCGKEHGMVIEDMSTGETTPIDWCKECFFTKGYIYTPIEEQVEINSFEDWGKSLREAEDRIIRDMIMSSACAPLAPEFLDKENTSQEIS